MKKYYNFLNILFLAVLLLNSVKSFGQLDACNAPTTPVLTVGTTCASPTPFTITNYGLDPVAGTCATPQSDGWYKFTTDASTTRINIQGTCNRAFSFSVHTSCTTLASVCQAGALGASVSFNYDVTPLTTYFLRIVRTSTGTNATTGTICVSKAVCSSTSTGNSRFINRFYTTGGDVNINNASSGYSANGYGNFTASYVSQAAGSSVNFVANVNGNNGAYAGLWVDWNNDLDFDDANETVYISGALVDPAGGTITVPAGTAAGDYRMRVRVDAANSLINPCVTIANGETEDYTFRVIPILCSGIPTGLTASAITTTTATVSWTAASPVPASGYSYYISTSATTPLFANAGTAAGTTTVNLTSLAANTIYYVWVRSNCGSPNGLGAWSPYMTFQTLPLPPTTTSVTVCVGGTGSVSATGSCTATTNVGLTISGAWNAATNPVAFQPEIFISNSNTCSFDDVTSNYTTYDFQVSVTGSYTFAMTPNGAYDGMGYIVIKPTSGFAPGNCGTIGTWIVGDDDSNGPFTNFEPRMTATLVTGITYTLVSTVYSDVNTTVTGSYQWQITPPSGGTILTPSVGGNLEWYTTSSGGTPIYTGSTFNPVGVAGSGVVDTNTPSTFTFYVACQTNPGNRSAATFTIRPRPTAVLSGGGNTCAGETMSIAFTGTAPWNVTFSNGTTISAITTNPLVFSASSISSTTTILVVSLASVTDASGCGALPAGMSGSVTIYPRKTWTGTAGPSWATANSWNPVGVPTANNCITIPYIANGVYPVISGTAYLAYAYSINITTGGRLTVNTGNTLTSTDFTNVAASGASGPGVFTLQNSSSLVQVNGTANVGRATMQRITQPMYRYDYTYWNSPMTLASNYTLGNLSSLTQPDKFYSWTPFIGAGGGNWAQQSTATIMDPTKGYIVRAPQTFPMGLPATKTPYTATFAGTFNNGDVSVPVSKGTLAPTVYNDKWNLIGNPYPSGVSAASLLNDSANASILDGTIYFWTHNNAPNATYPDPFYADFQINYTPTDYATWNKLGGVGTAASTGGPAPNGYIASGQSFFVRSLVASGNAIFKNSMRVANNNGQFFRHSGIAGKSDLVETSIDDDNFEKHRIWLNLSSDAGAFGQIMVGYAEGATLDLDRGYDGVKLGATTATTLYSVLGDQTLVIQGRPVPFDVEDRVPLGINNMSATNLSIRIDHFDDLFNEQQIYLEDKELNVIHDLKAAPYNFSLAAGSFNDRFVLRYTTQALGVKDLSSGNLVAFIDHEKLSVRASEAILEVSVFDITGKLLQTFKPQSGATEAQWNFVYAQGVYMAKVKLESGATVNRKLLNN